jgi:hypothetical protein
MSFVNLDRLTTIAEIEFVNIVVSTFPLDVNSLRIALTDGSFIEIWFSLQLAGRYSYHWERRAIDGTIFRHDNAPHKRWLHVKTYPRHFHTFLESSSLHVHVQTGRTWACALNVFQR